MNDTIQQAERELLHPAGLDIEKTRTILLDAAAGLDWADIFFQRRISESWRLEDGAVKTGAFSDERGAGLRALRGETTAFAGSDIISPAAIAEIRTVAQTAKTYGGQTAMGKISPPAAAVPMFSAENPISQNNGADKIALLQKIDGIARAADSCVENVIAHAAASFDIFSLVFARRDGVVAADIRPLVRVSVSVIINKNGKRESGHGGGGARAPVLNILAMKSRKKITADAVEEASQKLKRPPRPRRCHAGCAGSRLGGDYPARSGRTRLGRRF